MRGGGGEGREEGRRAGRHFHLCSHHARLGSIDQIHTIHHTTVFFYNLLLKLGSWQLFLLYEGRLKRLARRAHKTTTTTKKEKTPPPSTGGKSDGDGQQKGQRWSIFGGRQQQRTRLGGRQVARLRRLRKGIVWYYALSDLVILCAMAARHLVRGEGQELLRHRQMAGHDPHRYDELERRVVAFNW